MRLRSPVATPLEDMFQIMIVVAAESANGQSFLGELELSALETIFPTGGGRQCQADVGPQLALGTKAIARLQQRHEQSGANGADRRNLPEQFHGGVLAAFR